MLLLDVSAIININDKHCLSQIIVMQIELPNTSSLYMLYIYACVCICQSYILNVYIYMLFMYVIVHVHVCVFKCIAA